MERLKLRVEEVREETADAYTLCLSVLNRKLPEYIAGQYITLILNIDGEDVRRAYSISSAPGMDPFLGLTIKRVEGGLVSNYLKDHVAVGDELEALAPVGKFVVKPDLARSRHLLLFAAGSGISPIMSMIRKVLAEEPLSRMTLWYGNRTEDGIIFREQLEKLRQAHPHRLELKFLLSRPGNEWKGLKGRVDFTYVYQEILELFMRDEYRKQYYICGPSAMMNEVYEALEKHAVHPGNIFTEYFTLDISQQEEAEESEDARAEPPTLEDQTSIIYLDGKEHQVEVKAGQSLLDAAIEGKLDPPYACKSGLCVSCRCKKIRGEVYMGELLGLTEQEIEEGYILSCQAFPLTGDVEVAFEE